jgi:hypothetical protein
MPMDEASVGQRLETALALFDDGIDLMRSRLRRESPELSSAEIDRAVEAWLRPSLSHLEGDASGFFRLRPTAR